MYKKKPALLDTPYKKFKMSGSLLSRNEPIKYKLFFGTPCITQLVT